MASFAAQVASKPPTAEESSHFAAWYEFTHPGGAFEICLRPGGVLYAPGFPAPGARWAVAAPDRSRLALSVSYTPSVKIFSEVASIFNNLYYALLQWVHHTVSFFSLYGLFL
jgi:hypothetical protein